MFSGLLNTFSDRNHEEMSPEDKPDEFRNYAEECVKQTFEGSDWNKNDNMVLKKDL